MAYRHGGSIPSIWWDNEGRFLCNECGRHYASSKKTSHENQCKGQSVQPASSPHPSEPLGETFYVVHGTNDIPSLDEICTTSISTCKDVPHRCRYLWTKILTTALSSAVHENSVRAWTLLAILPKCVLPAPYRGGRKAHTSYSSYILKRMELWIEGKYATLWSEAIRDNERKRLKQQNNENGEDKSQIRSELLVRQGEYSRGMAAITAAPLAPYNEETLQKLQKSTPVLTQTLYPVPYLLCKWMFCSSTNLRSKRQSIVSTVGPLLEPWGLDLNTSKQHFRSTLTTTWTLS